MDSDSRRLYRSLLAVMVLMGHDPGQQQQILDQIRAAGGEGHPTDWGQVADWARAELARLDQEEEPP